MSRLDNMLTNSHIHNLLTNTIRDALEKLAQSGVGHIDLERAGKIFYRIDDKYFRIAITEMTREVVEKEIEHD